MKFKISRIRLRCCFNVDLSSLELVNSDGTASYLKKYITANLIARLSSFIRIILFGNFLKHLYMGWSC
jgi:hypothetical protein